MSKKLNILFLGETYRADAISWIKGIENVSGVKIDTQEIKTVPNRMYRMFQGIKFIFSLLIDRFFGKKYDIVLAERSTSYGFFSLFTNAKIKVVAQQGISDIYPVKGYSKYYKKILQRLVYSRVDLVHAWGYAMTYAQLKSGAPPRNIIVRPKGLDLSRYNFSDHLINDKIIYRAIVTRSLEDDYRHKDIIEAIYLLKQRNIHIELWIIGGGSLMEELKQQVNNFKLNDLVLFKGRIPNEDLPNLLSQAPIYISTPVTEGVSSSLFEAMACGCFPIVTNLPGNRAFIHSGINGILVTVAKPQEIANAIEIIISNHKKFRDEIIKNRNFIDEFVDRKINMEFFFMKYINLLNKKN